MSIRFKTVLGVAAIEAVLLCFLVSNGLIFLRDSNIGQLDKRARTTAELFATATRSDILTLDLATLESQVELLTREPGVVYAQVGTPNHGVLAQRGDKAASGEGISRAKSVIEVEGSVLGWVEVGLSDDSIAQTLKDARQNALAGGALGMLLSALFSLGLGYYLTRQLSNLTMASEEIAAGNFSHRIPVRTKDELGKVALAFNHMSEELNRSYVGMEERIESRTTELAQANEAMAREVVERKQAHREVSLVLSAISSMLVGVDMKGRVSKWNKSATLVLRTSVEQSLGNDFAFLPLTWDRDRVMEGLEKSRAERQPVKINNLRYERANDKEGFLFLNISPILDEQGEMEGVLILGTDITDFRVLEAQLSQAQKLESIGQLAAGIAHEINTPAQYVGDTVTFLRDATADLMRALDMAAELNGTVLRDEVCTAEAIARLRAALEKADYTFLKEEMPKSFARALEGIERVSAIVRAMRSFSHPGESEKKAVDINQAIENTVIVSRNEWKYVATMETDLDPNLPRVVCLPAELNQVFLNLVVNASHAVEDVVRNTQTLGVLRIATVLEDNHVRISITDSGSGIPEAIRNKIFDPFFTTKEVGKGTGQGLTMAYDIVVNKHGGTISFDTEEGRGTTFHIRLPLDE